MRFQFERPCNFIRLIMAFWVSSITSELEYRFNFFIELISVFGNLLGSLFILSLFYKNGSNLGGWSWSESVVVLGIYTILEGFTTTFLQPNLSRIVKHVQNGTLDFILLKPIESQIWLSFRMISPWGVPSIISGILLIFFALNNYKLSFLVFLNSSLMIISSLLILYSLWFIIATTSIWFIKVWNATEVLRATLVVGRYPISSYPSFLQKTFTYILPIAFLTTVPAETILDKSSSYWILSSIFVSSSMLYISNRFWKFAIKYYTSASS